MGGDEGLHQFLGVGQPVDEFSVFGAEGGREGLVEELALGVDVGHPVLVFAGDQDFGFVGEQHLDEFVAEAEQS